MRWHKSTTLGSAFAPACTRRMAVSSLSTITCSLPSSTVGTVSGVQRGMAVVTPDVIVGKVIPAYPTASQVLLITDPDFAAGVVTQKGQVHGTLKGQGTPQCKVDYVAFEEKVEPGEWVYTSGDDRIFPRGFRVGIVKAV